MTFRVRRVIRGSWALSKRSSKDKKSDLCITEIAQILEVIPPESQGAHVSLLSTTALELLEKFV